MVAAFANLEIGGTGEGQKLRSVIPFPIGVRIVWNCDFPPVVFNILED